METNGTNKNGHSGDGYRYAFDEFEIDPANRILLRDGKIVPLTGKVFDVLLVFAENPGRLLEKDELLERVWHSEFVEEGNLARNVSTLRKALGDEGKEHKYIATVQAHGYRFIADVVSVNGSASQPPKATVSKPPATSWRKWYWPVAAALACGAVILGYISFRNSNRGNSHISPIEQIRLTTGGKASKAAISPDGNSVVFTENGELKSRNLSDGSSRTLVAASPELSYVSLTLSPDGNTVYFSARRNKSIVSLYRLPPTGGEPEKIFDDIYGGISFSPDGKKFTFVRRYPELNENALLIADADGSNLRKVATRQRPNHFDGSPSWSPDGGTILCPAINTEGGFHFTILAVNAASGSVETVSTRRWAWLNSLVWLPDSKSILMIGQDENAVNAQVWLLDRFSGETRRMSDDSFIYESLSGTLDGEKFVAIKKRLESHVWIIEGDPVQITTGFDRYDGISGLAWAPDGRLLYHSRAGARDAIWRMNANGTGSEQLTPDGGSGFALSPDGRFLVFQNMESNNLGLSRLDLTNGDKKRLTHDSTDMTPHFTPDGQSIVYSHYAEKHSVNKISVDGSQASKLFDEYRTVSSPTVSPDGKKIAFAFGRTQADTIQSGIAVLFTDDNRLLDTFSVSLSFGTIYEHPTVQWSPDGRWLNYINYDDGVSNIWKIDTTDGRLSAVTNFKAGRIFNFAFSPDGTRLALARGTVESDVLVLRPSD